MQMNGQGAKAWEELTGRAYTQRNNIAIVWDNIVYSAGWSFKWSIAGGSEISGAFDVTRNKGFSKCF
jgi:SecD/SecF fusion protein